jgi:hypothetical protein
VADLYNRLAHERDRERVEILVDKFQAVYESVTEWATGETDAGDALRDIRDEVLDLPWWSRRIAARKSEDESSNIGSAA